MCTTLEKSNMQMNSYWDILSSDLQRYILCIAKYCHLREKIKSYKTQVSNDIISLLIKTRQYKNSHILEFTQYYSNIIEDSDSEWKKNEIIRNVFIDGTEGEYTLKVIKFIKKHKYFHIDRLYLYDWQFWLKDLTRNLWLNEENDGPQSELYNSIKSESYDLYTQKKFKCYTEDFLDEKNLSYNHRVIV